MNAPGQLSFFEPDRADAVRLLRGYLTQASRHEADAEKFVLLQCPAVAASCQHLADECYIDAGILSMYLQLLMEAGE